MWYCSEVAVAYDKSGGCQQSSASASCSLVASCTNCTDILGGTLLPNKQKTETKQNKTTLLPLLYGLHGIYLVSPLISVNVKLTG